MPRSWWPHFSDRRRFYARARSLFPIRHRVHPRESVFATHFELPPTPVDNHLQRRCSSISLVPSMDSPPPPSGTSPVRFDPTQSSLVFINCCFAISLTGPILLMGRAQQNPETWKRLLPGVALGIWLTFSVWRQYALYYIPLQFYRERPEFDSEEFTTLLITLALFAVSFFFAETPDSTPWCLAVVLVLTIAKLKQMTKSLDSAPCPEGLKFARTEFREYTQKLVIYLILVGVLMVLLNVGFRDLLNQSTFRALLWGLLPIFLQPVANFVRSALFAKPHVPNPDMYLQCLEAAWPKRASK